jgi:hypothetical protein
MDKEKNGKNDFGYMFANFVSKDPVTAAMLSKTIANNRPINTRDEAGNRKTQLPHSYSFKTKLARRTKRNIDAKMILKLLPDLELAVQILTSSILSPSDMMSTELNYIGPKNVFTSELTGTLINRLKEYFEEDYPIKLQLQEMLRDIIAEKGSYPVAVIPENVIDQFINGDQTISTEALTHFVGSDGFPKNLGILGSPTEAKRGKVRGLSLESFKTVSRPEAVDTRLHYARENYNGTIEYDVDDNLRVTDNLMVLKFPKLHDMLKKKRIQAAVNEVTNSFSFESQSLKDIPDLKIEQQIYRPRQFQSEQVSHLKKQSQLKRRSVGNPLIMKLPSESVLPVHVPGNVKKHIGYFVLLDEEGNPIEASSDDYYYAASNKGLNTASQSALSSNIIQKVNSNMGSGSSFDSNDRGHLDFASQVYADMVERDLISRIKNGVHSTSVQIASNEEIYRVMLSRALERKFTQILYIPIDYMTYMAFRYDDDGIGKSLLDESSTINTLRSVMMFSDVIASIKNSIGRTQVAMTIPENDPNPMKTIEMAQEEIVRSRQLGIPLGVTNPSDITEFIQRAGYEWSFTGHPGLPDLKFDFSNTATSIAKPDTELQEMLKKHSIMAFGLSPETVDNGFSGEFATTVVANNILLSKRVMQHQEQFTPHISDHLRKVATHSEKLVNSLREIVLENSDQVKLELADDETEAIEKLGEDEKKRYLMNRALGEFLSKFEVMLPKPSSVTLENQLSDLATYTDGLDKAIEAYVSDTFMTSDTAGELSGQLEMIKGMIKSHFTRKWLTDKGVMVELSELVATGEDGNPQLNLMKEMTNHIEGMVRSCVVSVARLKPISDAATSDLERMGAEGGGGSSSDGGGDTGDEEGGGDNFGGGADDLDEIPEAGGEEDIPNDEGNEPEAEDDKPAEGEEEEAKPDL